MGTAYLFACGKLLNCLKELAALKIVSSKTHEKHDTPGTHGVSGCGDSLYTPEKL